MPEKIWENYANTIPIAVHFRSQCVRVDIFPIVRNRSEIPFIRRMNFFCSCSGSVHSLFTWREDCSTSHFTKFRIPNCNINFRR